MFWLDCVFTITVCIQSTPQQIYFQRLQNSSKVNYITYITLTISSQLSIKQYMGLCVFSWPISLLMIERVHILCLIIITIKSEVWTIIHCLGHETMVCTVCLAIFLHHKFGDQGYIPQTLFEHENKRSNAWYHKPNILNLTSIEIVTYNWWTRSWGDPDNYYI